MRAPEAKEENLNEQEDLQAARQLWDDAAATFDNEPDHGLRDPKVRAAWQALLRQWLPHTPKRILDIGCGTGSLSVLMAELGHEVTGIDLSPAMIAHAKAKAEAAGRQVSFHVMDAAHPQLAPQRFDIILCRHLLWALPQPAEVVVRWLTLLIPGGRLILIEGFWHTGAGMRQQQILDALPASLSNLNIQPLSDNSALWGGEMSDDRYAVIAEYEGNF
jgi:2-polyprenyl-3-methyl-5-hydroxy-6-metoxy-1,4-benzoquinol methylase